MKKKYPLILFTLLAFVGCCALIWLVCGNDVAVLNPKGPIALKEKELFIVSMLLMLVVVIPALAMAFFIAWKYHDTKKSKYTPDWDYSIVAETVWWGVPFIIVGILSAIVWIYCRDLDPFKPLDNPKKPITVQVVALDWKWLFIYPEQNIASVNYLEFPVETPIKFEITSDAPMNSFWIPALSGQIFAMPGMRTELHVLASEAGKYRGSSANISGKGFAGMYFFAQATTEEGFNEWVDKVKAGPHQLGKEEYVELAKPSVNNPVAYYSLKDTDLFDQIMMKYMTPPPELQAQEVQCSEN